MVLGKALPKLNFSTLYYILVVLGILLAGIFLYTVLADSTPPSEDFIIHQLTPSDAQEHLLSNERMILIDVRNPAEWNRQHIDGATLIPMSEFEERALLELDRSTPILLTCQTGNTRSMKAAEFLIENGFTAVYNLDGGIAEWRRANLPLESGG